MKKRTLIAAALATALGTGNAEATWRRAETQHFILYSESDEAALKQAAFRLEMLDRTQRVMSGTRDSVPLIKPVVYEVADNAAVQATMAFSAPGVAGYYNATTRGPFAVTNRDSGDADFSAQLVLFHELTHYFMFQYFPAAYPTWYVEGFAELIGPTRIEEPNKSIVGRLSLNRYRTLVAFPWMPLSQVVAARSYADVDNVLMLYAEGWLLTHYLTLGGKRDGQLGKYLHAINQGKTFAEAATLAFGSIRDLDIELQAYARKRQLPTKILEFKQANVGEARVSLVPAAQAALMTYDIKLMSGVAADNAERFADALRRDAARFPDDPLALRLRAEADLNAGDVADASAAATHWLSLAPADPLAMLYVSRSEIAALQAGKSTDAAAWGKAQARLAAAAKLAPKQPLILRAYYESFLAQGKTPTDDAQNKLFDALDLIPQDDDVRYLLAKDFESRGMVQDAIAMIRVAAYASPDKDAGSAKEKEKQDKRRAKYRMAGETLRETPREMLVRLREKAKAQGLPDANPSDAAPPAKGPAKG